MSGRNFNRAKWVLFTCAAIVGWLGLMSIATTLVGLAVQDVVSYHPELEGGPNSTFLKRSRREGLFQICINDADSDEQCHIRSYGYLTHGYDLQLDANASTIIESRLWTVALFSMAASLTTLATALLGGFLHMWYQANEDEWTLLAFRLTIVSLYLISAGIYEVALMSLHYVYWKEILLPTKHLPDIFASWPEHLQRTTTIRYSTSYFLFWIAMITSHLAGLILFCATMYVRHHDARFDRMTGATCQQPIIYSLERPSPEEPRNTHEAPPPYRS